MQEKFYFHGKKLLTNQNCYCNIIIRNSREGGIKERRIIMNAVELKKVMLDNGDNNRSLAEFLDVSQSTFSSKLHENGATFKKSEIQQIVYRYNLSAEQIKNIFFS